MASRRANPDSPNSGNCRCCCFRWAYSATAAYLFIDPKPGLTIDQKIDLARIYLNYDRPEAALEQLNSCSATEKLIAAQRGRVHLLLAESLEACAEAHGSLRSRCQSRADHRADAGSR